MRAKQGMQPPGGPHYPISRGVVLRAPTYELLFSQIIEWRLRNGIEPGNPSRDVDAYICGQWPHFCHTEDTDGPPVGQRGKTLSSRVTTWTILRSREAPPGGFSLVAQDESERRAAICAKCVANKKWADCLNCHQSTIALLSVVRKLRGTKLDNSLMGCDVCGHDNQTAVHLNISDMPQMDGEEQKYMPPHCWKKL